MAIELAEIRRNPADDNRPANGTRFGSPTRMPAHVPRQRDRRGALSDVLVAVTRALDRRVDVSLMRGEFESTLRRELPVRSVRLR